MSRSAAARTHVPTDASLRRAGRRGRAGIAATVAGAAHLAVPAIAFRVVRTIVPSDGAHLRPGGDAIRADGLILEPLAVGPLRSGDRIVAVNGVPVRELAHGLVGTGSAPDPARPAWRSGATVPYDVIRDGVRTRVSVLLGPYPLGAAVTRTWGTIVFALASLLVATLIFVCRPRAAPAQVLFVGAGALLGATTWSLGMQVSDLILPAGFWLYQLTTVVIFMTYWTTILHFAAIFPGPLPWARSRA